MSQQQWRCEKCNTQLGAWRDGWLHLQRKKSQYLVRGKVLAICRRCAALNEADSDKPARSAIAN